MPQKLSNPNQPISRTENLQLNRHVKVKPPNKFILFILFFSVKNNT